MIMNNSLKIAELFEKLPNLPTIPRVVKSILDSLSDPNYPIDNLIKEVSKDQVLCSKVLRQANSSFYGMAYKVSTIEKAVPVIGINALKNIVLTSFMTNSFKEIPGFDLQKFWQNSLLAAIIAKSIADKLDVDPNLAYTTGLVHKIGVLLLAMTYPDDYCKVNLDQGCVPQDKVRAEFKHIGISHCQAGSELAERWGFPWVITDAIADYAMGFNVESCKLATVVYISSVISKGIVYDKDSQMVIHSLNKEEDLLSLMGHTVESFYDVYQSFVDLKASVKESIS